MAPGAMKSRTQPFIYLNDWKTKSVLVNKLKQIPMIIKNYGLTYRPDCLSYLGFFLPSYDGLIAIIYLIRYVIDAVCDDGVDRVRKNFYFIERFVTCSSHFAQFRRKVLSLKISSMIPISLSI